MTLRATISLFLFLAWHGAGATDMSVFGFQLTKPFAVPECPKMKLGTALHYSPSITLCFEFRGVQQSSQIASVSIMFPPGDSPDLIRGGLASAIVLDGNIEGIAFHTSGYTTQDRVLATLKQKYGEPTALRVKKMQNRMGAAYEAFDAVWSLPELEVAFQSVTDRVDYGFVTIDTKKGSDRRTLDLNALLKDKRPL